MSSTTSSSAAVQANTNVNTKPSQAHRKRGRKQATTNNGDFSIYGAPLKPKSQVVSESHMDALTSRASAEKAATTKSPVVETPKEVKMKDAPPPPTLILPFAGVAAAPSGQRVLSGSTNIASTSRQVSSTFSATSSKSSVSSASTAPRNSQGTAARPSGPWGNTGPHTHPPEREQKQAVHPPTKSPSAKKTATVAPTPDKDGWIAVVNKNSRHVAAASQNTSTPVVDEDETPKLSRRQKKQAAAALAAARVVPDISPPTPSPIASTTVTETAPKQKNEWSTVVSKKPGKKAPTNERSHIWNDSESTVPEIKVSGRSKKTKAPSTETDADFPALKVPKMKVPPIAKSGKTVPAAVKPPKPVAILRVTKNAVASEPTKKSPQVKATPVAPEVNNFTELTGSALDKAMANWSGEVGAHMSRLFGMVKADSFIKSTPEPVAVAPTSVPVFAVPVPVTTSIKKNKSGAAQKKAKKAKAAAEALAAQVAMIKPVAPIQTIDAEDVPEAVATTIGENSSAGDISSVAPIQHTAVVQVSQVTPAIEEKSIAEDISPVVPEIVQETIVAEEILGTPVITGVSENEDPIQVTVTPSQPFLDMAMCDERFCLQYGFDDVFEDASSRLVIQINDSKNKGVKQLQDIEMNGSRFSLQFGIEDTFEEEDKVSATDIADAWVSAPNHKHATAALTELNTDMLRFCEIVRAELLINKELDGETSASCEPSLVASETTSDSTIKDGVTLVDIRVNQLHMGGISIADLIEGVASENTTDNTYTKEQVAKVFILCANQEREMIGLAPSMGTSNLSKVMQSRILQNVVRVGRTKLAAFMALLEFEEGRTTLPGVVQACIMSAEKEMASRGTAVGKVVARALGLFVMQKM